MTMLSGKSVVRFTVTGRDRVACEEQVLATLLAFEIGAGRASVNADHLNIEYEPVAMGTDGAILVWNAHVEYRWNREVGR